MRKSYVLSQSAVRSPHPKPRPLASVSSLREEGLLRLLANYTSMVQPNVIIYTCRLIDGIYPLGSAKNVSE